MVPLSAHSQDNIDEIRNQYLAKYVKNRFKAENGPDAGKIYGIGDHGIINGYSFSPVFQCIRKLPLFITAVSKQIEDRFKGYEYKQFTQDTDYLTVTAIVLLHEYLLTTNACENITMGESDVTKQIAALSMSLSNTNADKNAINAEIDKLQKKRAEEINGLGPSMVRFIADPKQAAFFINPLHQLTYFRGLQKILFDPENNANEPVMVFARELQTTLEQYDASNKKSPNKNRRKQKQLLNEKMNNNLMLIQNNLNSFFLKQRAYAPYVKALMELYEEMQKNGPGPRLLQNRLEEGVKESALAFLRLLDQARSDLETMQTEIVAVDVLAATTRTDESYFNFPDTFMNELKRVYPPKEIKKTDK
ncbi:MAG: hypothetical protein KDK51_03465 [Deltaproteobacteria bacterium]|nr:hypothetical protein [Deltaproteobacteria bacterium]